MGVLRTGSPEFTQPRLTNTWIPSTASSQGVFYLVEPQSVFQKIWPEMVLVRCLPLCVQQGGRWPLLLEARDRYLSLQVRFLVGTEEGPEHNRNGISPLLRVPGDQSCCRPEG